MLQLGASAGCREPTRNRADHRRSTAGLRRTSTFAQGRVPTRTRRSAPDLTARDYAKRDTRNPCLRAGSAVRRPGSGSRVATSPMVAGVGSIWADQAPRRRALPFRRAGPASRRHRGIRSRNSRRPRIDRRSTARPAGRKRSSSMSRWWFRRAIKVEGLSRPASRRADVCTAACASLGASRRVALELRRHQVGAAAVGQGLRTSRSRSCGEAGQAGFAGNLHGNRQAVDKAITESDLHDACWSFENKGPTAKPAFVRN